MSPDFRDYLLDQLAALGPVEAKRMFGGGGLFLDGAMFGLVADDVLYLKVDDENQGEFEDRGQGPFTYAKKNRAAPVALTYFEAPPEALEDADELCRWARGAWAAARRSGAGKRGRSKRKARKCRK